MTASRARLTPALAIVLVAACLISLLSFGVRSAFGLLTDPVSRELGTSREVYSIAIALQNLFWGLAQPVAGVISDRLGARRVLVMGAVLYAVGVAWMTVAASPVELYLSAGVLVGLGMGGASYITVLAALGRAMPESHRSWALGLGTAAGSLGQFVIVPLAQAVIDAQGWHAGVWFLAGAVALVLPAAWLIRGDRADRPASAEATQEGLAEVLLAAARHPSYLLLVGGFFVCGFQLAFITTHFPPYLADLGLRAEVASWAIALVGLFNVLGAYLAGAWGGRYSKKNLLAAVYFARAVVTVLFITTPVTVASVLLFGAAMGVLWLSTAPLTSGLVATFFGTRYMATLFGFVFLSHQIGSFLGVWMGGYLFERTGSYEVVWWTCAVLAVVAGGMNLPIRERLAPRFASAALAAGVAR
ncbi:MAG TPA: MFS transporter [Burkholderiaceae bacterium]|nr:MFS transporter [Burkholderiaceae bacterium]